MRLFRIFRTPAVLGLAMFSAFGSSARADVPLIQPTQVRAWDGVAVLSVPEGKRFRLATQTGLGAPQVLPGIAPQRHAFDGGIGPGPDGSPVITFSRCNAAGTCELVQTTTAGRSEVPVAGTTRRRGIDREPVVWRNRLVFARRMPKGPVHLYSRPLDVTGPFRTVMLPDPPRPLCPTAR